MRVLVTGHDGYLGGAVVGALADAGHVAMGLDSYLFAGCDFDHAGPDVPHIPAVLKDVRDVTIADLEGFDAVIHLAAISNDSLGDLNPANTHDINHRGAVHLATVAKAAGVRRFLFSSSCSLYGAAGDDALDEQAAFNPVTPYGESKVLAEGEIAALADGGFSPTFLRNGTAYGVSPRLRIDLVVNNLTAFAVATGEVLVKSDGSPLRPLVHVEDIASAFLAVLEARRDLVHAEAFNVGRSTENYRIRDVAEIVEEVVPGSRVRFAEGAGPDMRNYRVNCDKIATVLPAYRPKWTVRRGVEELSAAFGEAGLTRADVTGPRYLRIRRIEELLTAGRLDGTLRWTDRSADELEAVG